MTTAKEAIPSGSIVERSSEPIVWCCPRCKGRLSDGVEDELVLHLDLCLPGPSRIDHEADREPARRLLAETAGLDLEATVRCVYASRPDRDEGRIDRRTREVIGGPARLRADAAGWLGPCLADAVAGGRPFLDLAAAPSNCWPRRRRRGGTASASTSVGVRRDA